MKWFNRLFFLVFAAWVAVTLTALVAMYHLWWTQERAQYVGKTSAEQRELVFRAAGLPGPMLQGVSEILRQWPEDVRYRAEGDFNRLSYVKYLLIPRMPDGNGEYALRNVGDHVVSQPGTSGTTTEAHAAEEYPAKIRGFLLSFLALTGLAALLRRLTRSSALTLPEGYAAAAFVLMIVVVLSRAWCGSARYGFGLAAAAGLVGLALSLPGWWRPRTWQLSWPQWSKGEWLLWLAFGLVLTGTVVWSAIMAVVVVPDDWDAWAMWGAKAKTLALGSGRLSDVALFGHGDYPLVWPAVWAFSGWLAGGWEEHWNRAWGAVFLLLTVWQMGMVVWRSTGNPRRGLLAAALFLSMPQIPLLASWSYAEAPFWLMLACGFGNILQWRRHQQAAYLAKAALFCAVAAYTKNEGLLFSMLCLLWVFLECPGQWRQTVRQFVVPLVLLLLPWNIWVRLTLHLDSRHFDGFGAGISLLTQAMSRLPDTLRAIGQLWLDVRQWNIALLCVVLASVWSMYQSRDLRRSLLVPWGTLLVYLGITLSYTEYLWLVGTAWDRLTAQVLVLLTMIVCLEARGGSQPSPEAKCPRIISAVS